MVFLQRIKHSLLIVNWCNFKKVIVNVFTRSRSPQLSKEYINLITDNLKNSENIRFIFVINKGSCSFILQFSYTEEVVLLDFPQLRIE